MEMKSNAVSVIALLVRLYKYTLSNRVCFIYSLSDKLGLIRLNFIFISCTKGSNLKLHISGSSTSPLELNLNHKSASIRFTINGSSQYLPR